MKRKSFFKLPTALIHDTELPYSTRRVGAALYAYSNALGTCRKSYAQIARLAGCSESTAVAAGRQLAAASYISFCRPSPYCQAIAGVGKGKNLYSVNRNSLQNGYTCISRDVFCHELTDAAFVLYLAVLAEIGNRDHGWPSIARLQKKTGAARSTVLAGLRLLKRLPTLFVQLRKKRNGAYGHNKYHPCRLTKAYQAPCQGCNAAVPALFSFYYKARQAICQGIRLLSSLLFGKRVGRNSAIYGYNLLDVEVNNRKERFSLLRRVYAEREDRRKIKNIISFLKQRAGAVSAFFTRHTDTGAAEPPQTGQEFPMRFPSALFHGRSLWERRW